MTKTIARVEGARQLRATMRAAGEDLQDLKDVNAQAAATVATAARPIVPVVTGQLESTIRSSGTKTAAVVRAGRATVPYAAVIEFGWPAHNIEPQPYLTTAAEDTRDTWWTQYQNAVADILNRVRGV